ncbi:response regulator [Daejeonella sp.]|jgi:DNA-binding response OmpR family regulator|uniref:response regulator n=1 Tax=Daejeonella sp. TaxID=2805397 RepID=UPI0037837EAE
MIKILLVEDELALRETLEEILSLNNFDVFIAASGEEALELAPKINPDLIICDILMPGITGIELIEKVHQQAQFKNTPFLFLSALVSEEDQNNGLAAGAKGYITKPFKASDLIKEIRRIC